MNSPIFLCTLPRSFCALLRSPRAAIKQRVAGVVIDGAVRDTSEIKELKFPTFCSGSVPAGPSKGFGGIIDGPISCGACPVMPGDIILGDDDGVVVVPLNKHKELLQKSMFQIENEDRINKNTELGNLPFSQFNLKVEKI